MRRLLASAGFVILSGFPSAVSAQSATVQQPVLRNFSVGTVVSVPDRGQAHLGSVSSAGGSRNVYGPFPSGTSTGWFRNHAGASARAWIHDLREMDERMLQSKQQSARFPAGAKLSRNAERAYRSLLNRDRSNAAPRSSIEESRSSPGGEDLAEKFYRLGRRAEQRGRLSLARLHYRMAAKHGSPAATRKLASGQLTARSR